jgi:Zn-dependent protease with chaperone function
MTFEARIAVIGLAAFAATGLLAACLVPLAARHIVTGAAVIRARRLAALRLLPSVAALAGGTLVTLSFVFFEPRQNGEEIGTVFPVFAALGVALLATALWRGAEVVRSTRRLVREWTVRPEPIALDGISIPSVAVDADFPIVAVAGVVRPQLIIARSVLASCSPEELRAVLAHEQGHIDRRDNLRRLCIASAPDVISWLPASGRMFAAWREATEEAADDAASQAGAEGRLRLASALSRWPNWRQDRRPRPFRPARSIAASVSKAASGGCSSRWRPARTGRHMAQPADVVPWHLRVGTRARGNPYGHRDRNTHAP